MQNAWDLEKMIIEHYPEMYLPESLEIGSLLHSRHTNRSIQEKISPNGVDKRMPAPNVGGQLPEYVQRNEEMTIAPEHWEPKDRGDEEYVSEDQRALQSEFPIGGYKHQPDAVPSGRNTAGKKLGKLLILGDSSSDLLTASNHVPSNRHPALLETRIRTTQLRNTITSESLVRQRAARARTGLAQGIGTFEFIAVPETAAAAQQESLREQQYFQEMLSGASGSVNDTFVQVNPQTWIIASAKTHSPEYVSAVTLTDPDQEFNAVSGTFSTSFTVIRKARPKLKVLTNLQCDFENKIPRSLADIICRHPTTCQPARGMEKPVLFNDIVDDVKEWELENSEILESHNSLMIPRFINHVITPHQSTPVAKSSIVSKDFANTTLYSAVLQNNDAERVQLPFQHRRAQRVTTTETSNNTEVSGSISGEVLRESLPRLESSFSRAKTQKRPGRLKARESKLSEDKAKHLIAIIVVVRCLLGGTDRLIKWPIVMQLFPGYSRPTAIKYRWNLLVETNSGYIDEFEKAFVENFVEAYRKGEVEAPDYDKIDNYNWQATIDWAAEHIRIDRNLELRVESRIAPSESNEQVERLSGSNHAIGDRNEQVLGLSVPPIAHTILLEEDRQKFDEHYFLEEGADYFEKSISDILNSLNPNTRRKHAMGELPFVLPLQISKRLNTEKDPTHADIVKSVVRANIIAPSLNYDPDRARARLVPFGEAALNTAIKDLQKAKIIKQENKGRTVPGRNFSMSKYFFDGFRGHWEIAILTAAVGYKHLLEHKFATDGYAEFSPHATQGQVLSILNLKLMGLIEVEFERPSITADPTKSTIDSASGERLISIWGFTEGDYKTTHVNTRNFVLPPRISPTASWIQDVPLPEPYPQPPAPHLPGSSTTGNGQIEKRIPLWYDIHDRIIPDVWELVVASVINTIALSPGTGAKDIVVLCKRMIEEWEVELVLKWMEEMGIAKRTTAGGDRFEPKEWWWYILGCNVATRPYG